MEIDQSIAQNITKKSPSNLSEKSKRSLRGDTILEGDVFESTFFKENRSIINTLVKSIESFDYEYWSVYRPSEESIEIKIGELVVLEISATQISFFIDSLSLTGSFHKFLLQKLPSEQLEPDIGYEDTIAIHMSKDLPEEIQEQLLLGFNLFCSKVLGNTFSSPEEAKEEEVLNILELEYKPKDEEEARPDDPIEGEELFYQKILSGESQTVEYKDLFLEKGQKLLKNPMLDEILRAIAGFANSREGGRLLVGVHDQKKARDKTHFINPKFEETINFLGGDDKFILVLGDTFVDLFEKIFVDSFKVELSTYIQDGEEKKFLHIYVPASSTPVFVKLTSNKWITDLGRSPVFFVRSGFNRTHPYSLEETMKYVADRFPRYWSSIVDEEE